MEIHRTELSNIALLHSLSTIQAAKTQFHLLTESGLTPTTLVSQIRICDILLGEIRAIRCSLKGRMSSRGMKSRHSVVARRNRSGRRSLVVPQANPANRSQRSR
jgi:hypothetical protein